MSPSQPACNDIRCRLLREVNTTGRHVFSVSCCFSLTSRTYEELSVDTIVGLFISYKAKTGTDAMAFFTSPNVFSCMASQHQVQSLQSNFRSGTEVPAKLRENVASWFAMPRKQHISVVLVGGAILRTTESLFDTNVVARDHMTNKLQKGFRKFKLLVQSDVSLSQAI